GQQAEDEEDAADDLAHPDKRGHDLRGRNPDLGEAAHPQGVGVQELLNALGVLCFSDEEPGTQGPRRVSKKELHDAFAQGWTIESIEPVRFEVRPDLQDFSFSEVWPRAWFAVVRSTGRMASVTVGSARRAASSSTYRS